MKFFYFFISIETILVLIVRFFFDYIEIFLKSYEVIANFNILSLIFIVSFLKNKKNTYIKIMLILSNIFSLFLIFGALFSIYKLKDLNQDVFNTATAIEMLTGKLINTDDYNFSYDKGVFAVERDQTNFRGRTLPIPYYNYIDIESGDKSSRIRISCSISGYGDCRRKIQEDMGIRSLDGLYGTAYIKPIYYKGGVRNLIFYLKITDQNLKKDVQFFENLYKNELYYYHVIYLLFILIYLTNIFLNCLLFLKIRRELL